MALVVSALFGIACEGVLLRRFMSSSPLSLVMITLGLPMLLDGLASEIWGTLPSRFPPAFPGPPVRLAAWPVPREDPLILGVVAVVALFPFGHQRGPGRLGWNGDVRGGEGVHCRGLGRIHRCFRSDVGWAVLGDHGEFGRFLHRCSVERPPLLWASSSAFFWRG